MIPKYIKELNPSDNVCIADCSQFISLSSFFTTSSIEDGTEQKQQE